MARPSLAALAALVTAVAQVAVSAPSPFDRFDFPTTNPGGLPDFFSRKLGLFIHWGAVSQWGTEISFPLTCSKLPCTVAGPGNTPVTLTTEAELAAHRLAYAALAETFNPTAFDPTNLAQLAEAAGFRYLTWVATHCDGYSNWNSTAGARQRYSIVTSPYGRDTFGMAAAAFRARGLRTGVYVCPSFWNNDAYWAPNATTSFGSCCLPNYVPGRGPAEAQRWGNFTTYLQGELADLAKRYAPDHYWLDSGTYAPKYDTHLEVFASGTARDANPASVMQIRDGAVWRDYVEIPDHSEEDAHQLLGVSGAGGVACVSRRRLCE